MTQTYMVRILAPIVLQVTIQGTHPFDAIIEGLKRLKVVSLTDVAGIEVDRVEQVRSAL